MLRGTQANGGPTFRASEARSSSVLEYLSSPNQEKLRGRKGLSFSQGMKPSKRYSVPAVVIVIDHILLIIFLPISPLLGCLWWSNSEGTNREKRKKSPSPLLPTYLACMRKNTEEGERKKNKQTPPHFYFPRCYLLPHPPQLRLSCVRRYKA